jgi:hypothetical protein
MWQGVMERCQSKLDLAADELLTPKHYIAHNVWVHAEAAKRGREVFEFEPQYGWVSLCAFISKEAPKNVPFPYRNDAAEIQMIVQILYILWLALGGVVLGIVRWYMKGQLF